MMRQSSVVRWPLRSTTIVLIAVAVLAIGGGAAAGTVMWGGLDARIPITVSQALAAEQPQPQGFASGRKFFGSVSDDQTKFSFALEAYRGDSLTVLVPVINRSSEDTVAEFSITLPEVPTLIEGMPGLRVEVSGSGVMDDVVRISPGSWTFTADAEANGLNPTVDPTTPDGLFITVSVAQTAMSGYYDITGWIRAVEF